MPPYCAEQSDDIYSSIHNRVTQSFPRISAIRILSKMYIVVHGKGQKSGLARMCDEHGEERTMNEMEGQTSEKMYLFPPSAKRYGSSLFFSSLLYERS